MTDQQLEKMQFIMESTRGMVAAMGGGDEDMFLAAAVTRAMALAPQHTMTPVERVKKINDLAGEAEFVIKGLFEKKASENGK